VTDDNRALLDMEDLEDFGMASREEVRDVLRAVHVAISEGYSQETEGGPADGRVVFALPSLSEVLEVLEHVEEVRRREAEEKMEKNISSRDDNNDVEEHKDQEQPKESSKSRCTCS
jgi:hypothetical protein